MIYVISEGGVFLHATQDSEGYEHWTAVPLPQPCWNPIFKGKRTKATGEWIGQWVHDGEPPPTALELCDQVDTVADRVRQVVMGDLLRAVEYGRAETEARTFKDAGYPANAVPRSVAAWAINGRTAQDAADGILTEAAHDAEMLYCVRERRLKAKELIRQQIAAGSFDQAKSITAEAIEALQSIGGN
ncbi:phage tail protein [Pseudomonas sp. HY13-MNA-CIBAN-0226]|uniref:phage tail protein n=1 Tax=Pseudomonas sp. HY13-MNA-CIBAN-0226 TaxID=3140473 RepID=UPI003319E043